MANKENLPPRREGSSSQLADDRSTPPGNFPVPAILNIGHWQHAAYAAPSSGLLFPHSKPSLARQRDHSACRRTDSALRVRKTRENLKQPSIYADIPPPCTHARSGDDLHEVATHEPDITGSTLVTAGGDEAATSPVPASQPLNVHGKVLRHKSVSRRMLSRMKDGIAGRSHGSPSLRADEAADDNSLMRRLSGKRRPSGDQQRRRRDSGDGPDEPSAHPMAASSQRSWTASTVETDELLGAPSQYNAPSIPARSDTATVTPSSPAPRASSPVLNATVPYIDLKVFVDQDAVDVGVPGDVWVAIEAVVRTRALAAGSRGPAATSSLPPRAIDMIVVICHDTLTESPPLSRHCIAELCARLHVAGDRLAVLLVKSRRVDAATINCQCAELHPLQPPQTAVLLDRLGSPPTTTPDHRADTVVFQPLRSALQDVVDQGCRQDALHCFIVSHTPEFLEPTITASLQRPAHSLKVGLHLDEPTAPLARHRDSWALAVQGDGDFSAALWDNMFRDLRSGSSAGTIPSLRICHKPMDGSRVVEVVGERAVRDVRLGQRCSLFVKVRVAKMDPTSGTQLARSHPDALFTELESLVGTLESNLLHIEARYRHTALPTDHVVTVRHVCSIRRPDTRSRWSLTVPSTTAPDVSPSEYLCTKLARHLASQHAPRKALQLITAWDLSTGAAVQHIRRELESRTLVPPPAPDLIRDPSLAVIVTDIDRHHPHHHPHPQQTTEQPHGSPLARTLSTTTLPSAAPGSSPSPQSHPLPHSASTSTILHSPITITTTTIPPRRPSPVIVDHPDSDTPPDSARQIWHHLRRHSLSASQTLALELDAGDEALRKLRDRALANKRSVGADTLQEWKWDEARPARREPPWL